VRPDLRGAGVLVTRPARQAEPLCHAVEAAGGKPIRFPVLEIRDPPDVTAAHALLADAAQFDLLLFVSANAVERAAPWLPVRVDAKIAAVGEATARALEAAGLAPSLVPAGRFDSEGLLALPALQAVAGWQVLIVRGTGGRTLLADTLAARGATVRHAEVYRRALPDVDPTPLVRDWEQRVQLIVATSNDVLDNLLALLGRDDGARKAFATPLVVVSERMATHARAAGFRCVVVAAGAGDTAIVDALAEARAHSPGRPHLLG
jgi:uroporphyrinogen-III synthase